VDREKAHRFDTEFAPRIVERIAALLDSDVSIEVIAHEGARLPTRVRMFAARTGHARAHAHPLDLSLTWDDGEIERLFSAGGEARFVRYLDALPRKLTAWQGARDIDLPTRSQADSTVLVGGLDFEA
jgi:hypothetical protein